MCAPAENSQSDVLVNPVLLQSGYIPNDPIEFHFYAGEEGGLLGSGHIVSHYAARQPALDVKGMLGLDTIVS